MAADSGTAAWWPRVVERYGSPGGGGEIRRPGVAQSHGGGGWL